MLLQSVLILILGVMFLSFTIFYSHEAYKNHKENAFKDERYKFSI